LFPGEPAVSLFTTYEITIATSNCYHAGTGTCDHLLLISKPLILLFLLLLIDANVFMTIYGTKGKSDKITLTKNGDQFERGSVDKFTFDEKDLGDLTKVVSIIFIK
jgi:hypothetical protein